MRDIPEWRKKVLKQITLALMLLELILSIIFLIISYIDGNLYFKGVGVGLLISGITTMIAHFYKMYAEQ